MYSANPNVLKDLIRFPTQKEIEFQKKICLTYVIPRKQ